MAILDNIRKVLGLNTEKKQSGSVMGYFNVGTQDKTYKYQDLAKEGYMKNAIVYRCVNEISKGASAVPYKIKTDGEVLENTELHDLLNRPNPQQSYSEFFNSLFGYLLLSGNAYVLKAGPEGQAPKELHLLRPDRIVIKGGTNYIPDQYEYMVNGRIDKIYPFDRDWET